MFQTISIKLLGNVIFQKTHDMCKLSCYYNCCKYEWKSQIINKNNHELCGNYLMVHIIN